MTAASAVATIAALTWRRLRRGRAVWVGLVIAVLPVVFAALLGSRGAGRAHGGEILLIELFLLAVLPALFVASSIGEDIEDRTTTYLWSRPLPRWTIVAGKLVALVPVVIALSVGSWLAACAVGGQTPTPTSCAALAGGATAVSLVAAGIATLVPKHGMPLTICYVLLFDMSVGFVQASLRQISLTFHVRAIAEHNHVGSDGIAMAVVAAIWTALAMIRIRRLEA
jgi:ABC-type Na+ efflux pump permease subunit